MTVARPRTGVFAVLAGREYLAESYPDNGVVTLISRDADNPDPELFTRDDAAGAWRAEVLTDDCERLDDVTTRAKYLAHECQVVAIDDAGSVGLYYLGPDTAKAVRDGFAQIEPGVFANTVNIYELASLWEHHADLLFTQWLATFGG